MSCSFPSPSALPVARRIALPEFWELWPPGLEGPAGVIVIVQHGRSRTVYQAGTASLAHRRPLAATDDERLASFSKAFNGAVALSLVSRLAAASRGGANSVSVTATEQLTRTAHPRVLAALRRAELLAVCAATARR